MGKRAQDPDIDQNLDTSESSMFVGAHVSAAGGVHNAVKNACKIGGRAFALFLKNQRTWNSKELSLEEVAKFNQAIDSSGFDRSKIMPHGSYLVNLANPEEAKRKKSFDTFVDDLQRCHRLGILLYNIHPGSTLGSDSRTAIRFVADSINEAHRLVPTVTVLIETMAGQGNVIGSKFEELRQLIDLVEDKSRIGVCLDTCHIFAAGYDIRTPKAYQKTMQLFEDIVGLPFLRGVHLNDSLGALGSCKDRHANIGKGLIGLNAFRLIMKDPRFNHIPIVLETPAPEGKEDAIYKEEIDLLYNLINSKVD